MAWSQVEHSLKTINMRNFLLFHFPDNPLMPTLPTFSNYEKAQMLWRKLLGIFLPTIGTYNISTKCQSKTFIQLLLQTSSQNMNINPPWSPFCTTFIIFRDFSLT